MKNAECQLKSPNMTFEERESERELLESASGQRQICMSCQRNGRKSDRFFY